MLLNCPLNYSDFDGIGVSMIDGAVNRVVLMTNSEVLVIVAVGSAAMSCVILIGIGLPWAERDADGDGVTDCSADNAVGVAI